MTGIHRYLYKAAGIRALDICETHCQKCLSIQTEEAHEPMDQCSPFVNEPTRHAYYSQQN